MDSVPTLDPKRDIPCAARAAERDWISTSGLHLPLIPGNPFTWTETEGGDNLYCARL